jgi:5-formyltetrahydrofolate cyclo-ligase
MFDPNPTDLKARLRKEALARRDALSALFRAEASRAASERLLALPELRDLQPVGGFWPIRSEIDVRPAMEEFHRRGQAVCLPVLARPAMIFRTWRPGDAMVRVGFGLSEPLLEAEEVFPRALVVPLAAFDREGGRLGYGKGHFDTAIIVLGRRHPVLTIGVAFSGQEIAKVPLEAHDRRMDLIVTETELIRTLPSS